ncbi:(E3-independent) E2 ubiquitin-conjugating enzyme UBE2O-like [Babylonia areolata]|uniref:(E3-independent) E2 ubiquitin-conjugating enzyme UBE2O-like n=1 Tax=Babylonia areolata TaxID=304850 RepID=UPI003FCF73AC
MAACSLFEDDVVCHVTPDNGYIYGLVMENSESVSSDEEDPRHDLCRRGCVRIAWHPRGKESYNTPENKVLLVDRALMVADVVRKFVPGQETQCGIVQDLQVACHLHITGTDKYIYNVDSKLVSPCIQLQKFENGYVTLDNWLGRVEEVVEVITLVLSDGARCELDDSDATYLEDISEKRPETVTFNEEYWYPGQQLKGELRNLSNANWLNPTLLYNSKNVENKKNSTFYAVVEDVKIRCIYVYWICCGYSKASISATSENMPPLKIQDDDINRLQLIDWFEHCALKLGDKVYYTIKEDDVAETQLPKYRFVPYAAQQKSPEHLAEVTHKTEDLYHQRFEESGKPRRRGSKRGMVSASSSNATATTDNSSISASSLPDGAMAAETDATSMETEKSKEKEGNGKENYTLSSQTAIEKGAGDLEADRDADDEYEDVDDKKDGTDSDDGSLSSSASGPKRRKRDRGIGIPIKTLRKTSRQARRTRPVAEIIVKPGSRVATEVCYTYSLATVIWQDGRVEKNIPSVELYPMHHLDELEYFPGTYITHSSAPSTNTEYGVITSCNRIERTCQVKWFQPYEVGHGTFPTEVIRDAEVSVYDIHDHPDYKFRPGNTVIRVSGFEDTEQTLQAVGQVVRLDPTGTVFVRWSDGSYTTSYPQDLYIVWDMSDYSNSSSEIESTSSGLYESTDSKSNDSWETEEEVWKPDGDGSQSEEDVYDNLKDDEEKLLKFKDMDEQLTSEIKRLMHKIMSCFETISEKYTTVFSKASDAVHSYTSANQAVLPCLKRILKAYRAWQKFEKDTKTGTTSFDSPKIIDLVASVKYELKRERSNKIKQHLAHVFESTNKGLLDQSKDVKKSEVSTDTSDLQVSQGTWTQEGVLGSSSAHGISVKNMKADFAGTSVDMEFGSSVDATSNTAGRVEENNSSSRPQDIEKDISCRLAAANVDENKDLGENKAQDNIALAADSKVREEQRQASDEQAAGDGDVQVMELLDTVTKMMVCIQECMNEMEKLVKNARRKQEDKPQEKPEEQEKKEAETKADSSATVLKDNEKESETETETLAGTEVDVRADNLEVCENTSSTSTDGKPPSMVNGAAGDEEDIVDPPGVVLPQGFFMCGSAPGCHSYSSKTCMPSNPKKFNAAIRKELKLLRSSLPHGINIKGFDDRMDLFSVLIDGPSDTPYEDGMFLFDVMLPHDYPTSPPLFHYLSYATDRLNPNLYVDGKVCVSLLGTWSGKGMEVWTEQSNLLQVLVSIQGLILVDEPYYNEAGYEKQRGHQIALENSRMYNEMALLRLVESMTTICDDPPKPFVQEVQERLRMNGPRMIARLRRWVSLSESMGERQSVVASGDGEKGAEGGVQMESKKDSSTGDSAASNGAVSKDLVSADDSTHLTDQAAAKPIQSPASKEPPPGHPHFPLLPMSKGFRLTLQKSLTQFEAALNSLKTVEQLEEADECGQVS